MKVKNAGPMDVALKESRWWWVAKCTNCDRLVPVEPDPDNKQATVRSMPDTNIAVPIKCPHCGEQFRVAPDNLQHRDLEG